ncbi:MAG: acyl-CoA dehydrogenase family protein, partial [Candidatus Binatia bacterium]
MPDASLDYFDVESLLSADERMVRDTARKYVAEEYLPIVQDAFRKGYFPKQVIPEIAALGFLGSNLPEKYGCAGLNNVAYGLINQELERGDSGLRSFVSVQSSLVMYPIYAFGSEEQKTKWLPKLARAEAIGCFGLTEPDYGSNPGGMITRATREKGGYRLNGTKRWITNGSIADLAIVWAKTEGDDPKSIRGFLVERTTPGFSAPEMEGKFSLRASVTSELVLEDCVVPEENLLPGTAGLKSPLACLTQARYGISWGAIGAAIACYECALDYSRSRKVFSR